MIRQARMRRSPNPAGALALALFAACGSAERRYDPGALPPDRIAVLQAAEKAYRDGDEAFPAQRDALSRDPVTAAWLTRMLVLDVLRVREKRDTGRDQQLLRAAAGMRDPIEVRAMTHLQALGAAAAPTVVGDLIQHVHGDRRELGVEILASIGAGSLPALQPALQSGEPRIRRTAVRAVAGMEPGPATAEALRTALQDGDFGVRGEAARGLGRGPGDVALLVQIVEQDGDAFVRRSAAQALGACRDRAAATALVQYLERCKQQRDHTGEQAAQAALQALSGGRGPRTVEAWRSWCGKWDPAAPVANGR